MPLATLQKVDAYKRKGGTVIVTRRLPSLAPGLQEQSDTPKIRELRGLWQARERSRLRSQGRGSGWNLAATPSSAALARISKIPLARLLRQAHHTDRVIKGLAGGDAWTAVTGLAAGMAGALQATEDSGRVPK